MTDLEQSILETLLESLGTAFNTDEDSYIYMYMKAAAKVLATIFEQNNKMATMHDPDRMAVEFLERWERILNIPVKIDSTIQERRDKIKYKLSLTGTSPTIQQIHDLLSNLLGDIYKGLFRVSDDDAGKAIEGNDPSGYVVVPGGTTIPFGDWYSTISTLRIFVEKPSYISNQEFIDIISQIYIYIESYVSSWMTYHVIMNNSDGTCGFKLDDELNLNFQFFC